MQIDAIRERSTRSERAHGLAQGACFAIRARRDAWRDEIFGILVQRDVVVASSAQ
jgi:hypothetical protein